MKIKRLNAILTVLLLFSAIWSQEPVKMVLSAILLNITIKFTLGEDKVIGKELIERNLPINFIGVKNVKFKNW